MSLAPYNITISSQCGTIIYNPYRDGPISGGWNVSYSGSPDSSYQQQLLSSGTSSHRTTFTGATLEIDWIGTAIYLYGSAASGSYSVTVDGGSPVGGPSDSSHGVLNSISGLEYGTHRAVLTVVGGNEVTFGGAVLTIGMGDENAVISNTTQLAATDNGGAVGSNPFFDFSLGWTQSDLYSIAADGSLVQDLLLGWSTAVDGATVSFSVSNTTAFFLVGTMNHDHQLYNVTFTPIDDTAATKTLQLNDSSRWLTQDELLYWESGLNSDLTYDVLIKNIGAGISFTFYSLVMMDAISSKTVNTSSLTSTTTSLISTPTNAFSTSTPTSGKSVRAGLSPGVAAGISVGTIALIFIAVLVFFLLKRRRTKAPGAGEPFEMDDTAIMGGPIHPYDHSQAPADSFYRENQRTDSRSLLQPTSLTEASSADYFPAGSGREIDAGPVVIPMASLPPDYDPLWIGRRGAPSAGSQASGSSHPSGVGSMRKSRG